MGARKCFPLLLVSERIEEWHQSLAIYKYIGSDEMKENAHE
jgi:hypothetical protein